VKRRIIPIAVLLLLLLSAAGCGYSREARGVNVAPSIRKIAIPTFRNDTYEAGLEATLTDSVRKEFLLHRFVELSDVEDADAVVVGIVRKFTSKAISFSKSDFATEYRASIQIQLKIVLMDGTVLWEDKTIAQVAEYQSTPDIFDSEANKKAAIQKISDELARDFHARVFDGFPK
jgi:hypothetical protein